MGNNMQLSCMNDYELERVAHLDTLRHFRDNKGEGTADGLLILADAMTYMAGITAIITGLIIAEGASWVIDGWSLVLLVSGGGLWICSQSLNDFRRLLPLWLRAVLSMKTLPASYSEQSTKARRRRVRTMLIAAVLTALVASHYSTVTDVATRSGVTFDTVLWALVLLDLVVAAQWARLLKKGQQVSQRPGGWAV
jgi:hypothetical protein